MNQTLLSSLKALTAPVIFVSNMYMIMSIHHGFATINLTLGIVAILLVCFGILSIGDPAIPRYKIPQMIANIVGCCIGASISVKYCFAGDFYSNAIFIMPVFLVTCIVLMYKVEINIINTPDQHPLCKLHNKYPCLTATCGPEFSRKVLEKWKKR